MKETKIEKLIFNLSNRWDCSPQEAVDRLNSMNESEINKLINSMTNKFKNGGMIDCLRKGGSIKDCGCGSKIEKARGGKPDLGKYHLQLPNERNYSLSGYTGYYPRRTVETLTTPEEVITRTIEKGDTVVTRNGQLVTPTAHFHQNLDKMKEQAILENKGQDYLDFRKRLDAFDEGGKVRGGNWRDYHTIINAPGDTLRFKQYFSGPTTMQTHPEGGVTYTKSSTDGISHMYGGGYKPNMWERFVLRMSPVDTETEQNWQQLIKNHANDPAVKDKTQKKACGGSMGTLPKKKINRLKK